MKRIAIYIDYEINGSGISQYSKMLINALNELPPDNFSVTVIYTSKCWETYLSNFHRFKSVFLSNNKFFTRLYQTLISLGCQPVAKQIAHKFDPKIAYIENQKFDFIIFPSSDTIACLVNANVIGTIHDLMHRYERRFKESGSIFRFLFRENYYKKLLLSSIAVLVDSHLGEKQVLDSYKKVKAKIFALPYIAPDYIYSEVVSQQSLSNYPDSNGKYLFYPAVFWPHKNHINLIKAIKILKERGQLIKLLLGGKKQNEYTKLLQFVNDNGLEEQVKFLGYVPDVDIIHLYRNAFAMIMPTFYGPTNIPPIEAILLNCPPIVSNKYGMPEQFEDAALYFDPNSSLEIADAIESLLTNSKLRDEFLEKGEKIKGKFSQERFVSDFDYILRNLDTVSKSENNL